MPTRRFPSWVYILQCSDNTFYTGCTTNLKERVYQHKTGQYEGYTKKRRPVELLWYEEFKDINEAIDAERQIKGWSRAKKEALMRGDFELLQELSQSSEKKHKQSLK